MKSMLSKSRFIAGLQCPLRLWYQCYNRELATPASPSQQAIFAMGHEVGLLATKLYPAGVYVSEDYMHHREAQKTTKAAITNSNVPAIFEGAFAFDGIRIRVDILERLNNDRWNMIEVKSSTSSKTEKNSFIQNFLKVHRWKIEIQERWVNLFFHHGVLLQGLLQTNP